MSEQSHSSDVPLLPCETQIREGRGPVATNTDHCAGPLPVPLERHPRPLHERDWPLRERLDRRTLISCSCPTTSFAKAVSQMSQMTAISQMRGDFEIHYVDIHYSSQLE